MSLDNRKDSQKSLATYRPMSLYDVWHSLQREMWDSWRPFTFEDSLIPRMDVYEENDQLVVKTELPGIEGKDLDISLEGDLLTIKAEKQEETGDGKKHHTRERFYGKYVRSLTLPYAVKADGISAALDKGILEIKFPKAEEAKVKKIEVKA
jgi:HSP20 family protein